MAKKEKNLEVKEKTTKKKETKKDGIWAKIVLFFKGVKTEWQSVKWPNKKEMIKYSVATIILIVGCSVFFYVIDVLLAFLHSLGK